MRSDLLLRQTPSPHFLNIIITIIILVLLPYLTTSTPTAYDELLEYNFPVGLLPVGVTGYNLNKQTGEFQAFLDKTCSFKIQGYDIKYKSTISGVIEKGRLRNLKGINVKILVVWLNIVEVSVSGDELEFSVGIMSAGFGISNFVESPQCGCGFDCNDVLASV